MKAVIFDMDGVLINTEPLNYKCWETVLGKDGYHIDFEMFKPCIGATRDTLFKLVKDNFGIEFDEAMEYLQKMRQKRSEIVEKEGFPQLSGVREMIMKLHQEGYLLTVASSSSMESINEILEFLNIKGFFECLTSGMEVENSKPAPDVFLKAAEKLGQNPEDCLVVEDSTNGGKAAEAAGMKCVWYHNPDSGDQSIPHAVLEISEWNDQNVQKIMEFLKM